MPPTSVTEIQSFLGLAGYYRHFIKDFSKIAKPMMKLLEKNKDYRWTQECQASFEELKKQLTLASVLILPDGSKTFDIYCDASWQLNQQVEDEECLVASPMFKSVEAVLCLVIDNLLLYNLFETPR
jgi:hypothetical protein